MPRFVLLYHRCQPDSKNLSHWDWMLEQGEKLWTWQLLKLPVRWQAALEGKPLQLEPTIATQTVSIHKLADHRLAYLDYEGPISGGRGEVERCDQGTYQILHQDEKL